MLLDLNILHVAVTISIGLLIVALFVRFIASWFQIDERFAFIRFLAYITDPFVRPIRRVVKPVWILDLSFIIAFFMLSILRVLLLQALPQGW
jgi:YggT family protein